MIQRVQTIFWFLTIIVIVIYTFQVFDVEMDFRIYQQPRFAILSGITIIALFFAIFSFHRRKRQQMMSHIAAVIVLIQAVLLIFDHSNHIILNYIESFLLLGIAFIFNICGSIFIGRDIKLLENSSRLR